MPVMSGTEATEIIRNSINKDIPIIALTADAFSEHHAEYMLSGMSDIVTKVLYLCCRTYKKPINTKKLKDIFAKFGFV